MAEWVNYKEIMAEIAIRDVLEHYQVDVKIKGSQATGFCPLPTHQGTHKLPSFSVNLDRGTFQCSGCGAKGNVIDFIVRMENLNPDDKGDFHKAALLARDLFIMRGRDRRSHTTTRASNTVDARPVRVNPPLDFELKGLDRRHPYLAKRGFHHDTVDHFGLGYCNRGMLQGRIAIPLHDSAGALVGYAGRLIEDSLVSEDNPKYKMPATRERDGVVYEFRKSLFLYNGHRLTAAVDELIVVEGFTATWWLWQELDAHVVGLIGASCSPEQVRLIVEAVEPDGRIWIMPNGDEAGGLCAVRLLGQLAPYRFVRWAKLDTDKQPTDYTAQELDGFRTKP